MHLGQYGHWQSLVEARIMYDPILDREWAFISNYAHQWPSKSEKGAGWTAQLCVLLVPHWQDTPWWPLDDPKLTSSWLRLCLSSHPQTQCLHHIHCLGAAFYTMLGLDDLLGTYRSYWDVVVTAPPRLHWEAGCTCLQLQQTCAHLQGECASAQLEVIAALSPIVEPFIWLWGGGGLRWAWFRCLPHLHALLHNLCHLQWGSLGKGIPIHQMVEAPISEAFAGWGLNHGCIENSGHQSLVHCGEVAAVMGAHCMEPTGIHLNCRPNEFLVLLHDKVSVVGKLWVPLWVTINHDS